MKKKEKSTRSQLDVAELAKELSELRKKVIAIQIARRTKPAKNVREIKMLRRDIAIIRTYITQKELSL